MASELPYFRFYVSEWMNGDIDMENFECKGLFIDICSWYWFKDCSVTKAMLEKKYTNVRLLEILYGSDIIKVCEDDIEIEFLNAQFDILSEKRKARQAAGSKGGKQKRSNAKAKLKQKRSYKYNNKYNNKDNINIPALEEFINYAKEKKTDINIESVKLKYESWKVAGWKDGNDKDIINWKSKLLNTIPYLKESNIKNGWDIDKEDQSNFET